MVVPSPVRKDSATRPARPSLGSVPMSLAKSEIALYVVSLSPALTVDKRLPISPPSSLVCALKSDGKPACSPIRCTIALLSARSNPCVRDLSFLSLGKFAKLSI